MSWIVLAVGLVLAAAAVGCASAVLWSDRKISERMDREGLRMATMTELKGHGGSRIRWDGERLTIEATSTAGRVALFGKDGADGQDQLVLTRDQIADVEYKPGTAMISNGILKVRPVGQDRPIQIHFLRKYRHEFADVARELGADVD